MRIFYCVSNRLTGGGAESCSHVTEGMATALQAFDDLQTMRDSVAGSVKPDPQKYCILISNSQPYETPVFESISYNGMLLDDIVTEMAKRDIKLSIFSPRKMSYLFKLFEKSGGDLQQALSRNYAKDRRHLILLNGFQLQERPASPQHSVTTAAQQAQAVSGQGVKRPASPATRPSSAGPVQPVVQQNMPPAGVPVAMRPLPPPPPPFPASQRPGTRSPVPGMRPGAPNMPNAPAPVLAQRLTGPPPPQQPIMQIQNQGPMVRMTTRPQRMPTNQFIGPQPGLRPAMPQQQQQQQSRMPAQAIQPQGTQNQNVMLQIQQQQQIQHQQQQQMQQQQQQQLQFQQQQQQIQMQGQPAVGLQIGQVTGQQQVAGGLQTLLISGQQQHQQLQQQPQVSIQLSQISASGQQVTVQDQSGLQQLMQQHPGEMNQPITIQMVNQQGGQQLIGPSGQQVTLPAGGDMMQQPQQQIQMIATHPGQQPQMVAQVLSQAQPPQPKQRKIVWSGLMNYEDKGPGQTPLKTCYRLPCQISCLVTATGVPEADTTGWPQSLTVQLLPRQLMMKMIDTLKNQSVHVGLHLSEDLTPENKPGLEKLIKSMSHVSAGCVQFQVQGPIPTQMRIMIIIYVEEKKVFYGFIPNQQETFFQQMKAVVQNHKKQQQQEQEKLRLKVSNVSSLTTCSLTNSIPAPQLQSQQISAGTPPGINTMPTQAQMAGQQQQQAPQQGPPAPPAQQQQPPPQIPDDRSENQLQIRQLQELLAQKQEKERLWQQQQHQPDIQSMQTQVSMPQQQQMLLQQQQQQQQQQHHMPPAQQPGMGVPTSAGVRQQLQHHIQSNPAQQRAANLQNQQPVAG